ncbi:MAG: hypothetical protein ABNG98_02325 [Flavobacterium sp.]|jgi:hypothetical protein
MDIPNTIIGIILSLAIIIPIYIINSNVKKKRNKLLKALNELSSNKSEKFSDVDLWNSSFGIGLKKNELCFLGKNETSEFKEIINLNEVKKCLLVKTNKIGQEPKSNHDVVKLYLHLELEKKRSLNLVFFETNPSHFIVGEEMRIAKKWQELISSII